MPGTMPRKQAAPLHELAVLNREDLARWLGVSLRTLDRLQPPALPLPGKHFLVRDVLAWLESRRSAA